MDPTTTLITFLLQTDPMVQSVQLIGSWDNFSTCYAMKRDVRRGRGQWRGCYSFKDIVCDDEATTGFRRRNGGLKMGATYYYYYEEDGSTETYDSSEPWTTACPYLPGQTVNTLNVPIEHALRHRRASLTSMRRECFKTMDPEAKFSTLRPAPVPVSHSTMRRLGSASSLLHRHSSTRSLSPAPSWRRFFTHRLASRDSDGESLLEQATIRSVLSAPSPNQTRCSTPSEGSRTRDISPESLRRFLSEDTPARPDSDSSHAPALAIPENIAEEVDDDDNFASWATSENQVYGTSLSPPPFQRPASSDTIPITAANSSSLTLTTQRPSSRRESVTMAKQTPEPSASQALPKLKTNSQPRWSSSATCSLPTTPVSPQPMEYEPTSFYDSCDEDEVLSGNDSDNFSYQPLPGLSGTEQAFKGYSLPRQRGECKGMANASPAITTLNSPQLLARGDSGIPVSGANLLGATIDTGLDDFVSELSWIVDAIGSR
ncbi:Uncharacterized protein TCAP_00053 [Tolypocladium capitatum]|uniref:Uncharacterized protein n=1 Tax=Tolypocladium capitatum TaxID=45235 RepID=A0A2K3QR96_9HYPO|nr:Uncharacterized protein TCAP_00053 [Tolypocladium capitatum]